MENNEAPKKVGRPNSKEYSAFELKRHLREIALTTDEVLTRNKLAKISGIERRNWDKILPQIEAVNNIRLGNVTEETIKDYPLPNTDEVFALYGGNMDKLKEAFQSLINLVSRMWQKCLSFDSMKLKYELKLQEKDRQIDELQEKLKKAKEDTEFHKAQYRQVCGESIYSHKRKELGIPNNVIKINKGDTDVMALDALDNALNEIFEGSKQTATTKKDKVKK